MCLNTLCYILAFLENEYRRTKKALIGVTSHFTRWWCADLLSTTNASLVIILLTKKNARFYKIYGTSTKTFHVHWKSNQKRFGQRSRLDSLMAASILGTLFKDFGPSFGIVQIKLNDTQQSRNDENNISSSVLQKLIDSRTDKPSQ